MIGETISHYKIIEKLGEGGMGVVYRAHDENLDRDVAIKVLPKEVAQDPEHLARFQREAKAVAALKHPNIVTIYSVEVVAGTHFITMELVEGQALSEVLPAEGFPLDRFFEIAIPLTKAVTCAHTLGITHRDLKPANIMIDGEHQPKVLDFGLVKRMFSQAEIIEQSISIEAQITQAGQVLGTTEYMSPEQASGGEIGGWSDIFALGIIFYEMLSGVRPFRGDYAAEIMYKIVNVEVPRLASIPNSLVDIVDRCLRKAPEDRFARADDLLHALQDLVEPSAAVPRMESEVSQSPAKVAFDRGDWKNAYQELDTIREQRDLSPQELEMIGACAAWLGYFDEWNQTIETAYAEYAKLGRNIDAARVALQLVRLYIEKNAGLVAGGWQKRAEHLLKDEPDCVERGYLLRRQTSAALGNGDYSQALEFNRQCGEIAERFQNPDLQAEALHDRGQILIAQGDVEDGTGCIDEAMIYAVSGEVQPSTLGNLYCRTMIVCRSLADFKRVREWSEAAWRWTETYGALGYAGVCRIYSSEMMRHLGRWEEAEHSVRSACREFTKSGIKGCAGEGFNELGELALRKGDYREAEKAFQQALDNGFDPVPGLPLLRLFQGNGEAAQQTIERSLNECTKDRLRRAKLLVGAIIISLANHELSLAEDSANELRDIAKDFGCPCFKAHALMGQGSVKIEQDDHTSASPPIREAWAIFNDLGFPYDAARARTLLAKAYLGGGNNEDAKLQLGAARKTFSDLGAKTDLEVVSTLMKMSE